MRKFKVSGVSLITYKYNKYGFMIASGVKDFIGWVYHWTEKGDSKDERKFRLKYVYLNATIDLKKMRHQETKNHKKKICNTTFELKNHSYPTSAKKKGYTISDTKNSRDNSSDLIKPRNTTSEPKLLQTQHLTQKNLATLHLNHKLEETQHLTRKKVATLHLNQKLEETQHLT